MNKFFQRLSEGRLTARKDMVIVGPATGAKKHKGSVCIKTLYRRYLFYFSEARHENTFSLSSLSQRLFAAPTFYESVVFSLAISHAQSDTFADLFLTDLILKHIITGF